MSVTLDQVTAAYTASREEIRGLKAQIEKIEELQEKRANYLLQQLQKDGLQNVKTQHGTVYLSLKESVTVSDADSFFQWVRDNDKFEFLNKAANKTAVLEAMGDKRNEQPPPGVNYSAVRVAQIRKS
jgi:aspartate/methionine/tyrosine aminotransferase